MMREGSKIPLIVTLIAMAVTLAFSFYIFTKLNDINSSNENILAELNVLDEDKRYVIHLNVEEYNPEDEAEYESQKEYETYTPEEYAALKHAENSCFLENVPYINQMDEGLPSGCEGVSLTMALNYAGFDVTARDICTVYMPQSWEETDMNNAFIGDPTDEGGWGCYAPVIVKTAYNYFDDYGIEDHRVLNMTNSSIYDIFEEIRNGNPVIIWATESFNFPEINETENFTWVTGEHCMLVTGYDEKYMYLNDPIYGYTSVDLKTFERIWALLGRQAVVIH